MVRLIGFGNAANSINSTNLINSINHELQKLTPNRRTNFSTSLRRN